MKPIQFIIYVLIFLLFKSNHALANETTQTIRLIIPVVTLLDVADVSPSFSFISPNKAGEKLTVSATNNIFAIALTSNNPNTSLNVKLGEDLTSFGVGIRLVDTSLGNCGGEMILTTIDQTYCNIGSELTPQGALPTMEIDAMANANEMAAYGNYAVDVIYTLTEN